MITLENEKLKVQADPLGAELKSVVDKELGRECLWTGDPAYWTGHAPVLFPVVGLCHDGKYRYKGVEYELRQHGFARNSVFTVSEAGNTKVVFSLRSNDQLKKIYPFDFTLYVTYELSGKTISETFDVVNEDKKEPMYFSIGGHPGFLFDGGLQDQQFTFNSREDLDRLQLAGRYFSRTLVKNYMNAKDPLPVTEHLFDNDAVVFHDFAFTTITLANKKTGHGVTVDLTGFPYVGMWAKPGAPYACIEPWFGLADYEDFNGELPEKDGIQKLDAAGKFHSVFTMTFQ